VSPPRGPKAEGLRPHDLNRDWWRRPTQPEPLRTNRGRSTHALCHGQREGAERRFKFSAMIGRSKRNLGSGRDFNAIGRRRPADRRHRPTMQPKDGPRTIGLRNGPINNCLGPPGPDSVSETPKDTPIGQLRRASRSRRLLRLPNWRVSAPARSSPSAAAK